MNDIRKEWLEEAYQRGRAGERPNADEGDIASNIIDLNACENISWGALADLQNDITAEFERGLSVAELSIEAEIEGPDGTSYPSVAAAKVAGIEIACQQFLLCGRAADVMLHHPVLVGVPTCNRCAEKVAELSR